MSKLPQYIHAMCTMCVFKKQHDYEFHHKKKHWMVHWYHSYVDVMCVADNVLLSEDGRQCFLCDFGLSETLNQGGYSTKTFRGDYPHTHTSMHVYYEAWFMVCACVVCAGNILRGTESHMPPEVARGDPRSAKADVWSSCCMLLHMLNGHQPWTRYYPHPLYLKVKWACSVSL